MIRFGLGVLFVVCVALAGWAMRPAEKPYADLIGVQDLPVIWTAEEAPTVVQPASGIVEREVIMDDGVVVVEGWLRVTALPFSMEVIGPTPIRNATGFSFLRADLPSAEGARAFSIVLEPDSDGPVPICLAAVLGGEHQRLSTHSCP